MAFSGGVFSLVSGNPVVTGTTISSTWANNTLTDIASNGLSLCVLKDGSQTITGNIPMNSFKFTGLAVGSSAADSARFDQIQAGIQLGTSTYLTGVAGTNTITATATPTPAYTVGQRFTFVPAVTNTGATTLNISSVGAGAVQWAGAALTGGELVAGVPVTVLVTATTPVFEIIAETQFPDSRALVVGATDATKKIRFEADGITTGTTRVATMPDRNINLGVTLSTEQATTSGTTIDFTGIPSGVRRITIMLVGVSTNGTSPLVVQIGDSGGIESSGYLSIVSNISGPTASTTFFRVGQSTNAATDTVQGQIVLSLENASNFTWVQSGLLYLAGGSPAIQMSAGSKATSAELDRVRLTTVNGTDTFDAGVVNISYEF